MNQTAIRAMMAGMRRSRIASNERGGVESTCDTCRSHPFHPTQTSNQNSKPAILPTGSDGRIHTKNPLNQHHVTCTMQEL